MRVVSVLGSTGSIGVSSLEVIARFPDRFKVSGLSAYTNVEKLAIQVKNFAPKIVAICDEAHAAELDKLLYIASVRPRPEIVYGDSGYSAVAAYSQSDVVLNAIVGAAGLIPSISAIDAGKDVALANKETLVMAGEIVMNKVAKNKIKLMPVDSEHSAIYQCLLGNNRNDLEKLLLTASGGPFLNKPKELFCDITVKSALKHPNWSMGNKITIDSATLMNKSLEIIEAMWLFDVGIEQIDVLIHPQSIVHSMVSYRDGAIIGQMGIPDMKVAIAYAFSSPERLDIDIEEPNFFNLANLSFLPPDLDRFPCLTLASVASKIGGAGPAVMNASNEIAVQAFLDGKISFTEIFSVVKTSIDAYHSTCETVSIQDIMIADQWARVVATDFVNT